MYAFCLQGPDAVHIQQIGQRELKRAPAVTKRHQEVRKKEKTLAERYNVKVHLKGVACVAASMCMICSMVFSLYI